MLGTLVRLCVFLAYGTTASVARQVGAGNTRGALVQGIDGVWLAVLIGVAVTALALAAGGGQPWTCSDPATGWPSSP